MATKKKSSGQKSISVDHRKTSRLRSRENGPAMSYHSPALAAIHESMADLLDVGLLDATTMRDFDVACLTPLMKLTPSAIRGIREKASISQSVFALHLNVTTGVVSKWERGEKQPSGTAAKLLTLAAKNGLAAIA